MEIITNALQTLKELDWKVQIVLMVCVLAGFLAFAYYGGFTQTAEETAPVTTTKTVDNLNVNATNGDIGAIQISQ